MSSQDQKSGIAIWVPVGLALGASIGVATHNIGLWMPLGVALGVVIGTCYRRKPEE